MKARKAFYYSLGFVFIFTVHVVGVSAQDVCGSEGWEIVYPGGATTPINVRCIGQGGSCVTDQADLQRQVSEYAQYEGSGGSPRLAGKACSSATGGTSYTAGGGLSGPALTLPNPLGNITDPRDIFGYIIKAILGVVGSLALAVFIYGGFTWVISAGNEEKVKKGKDMMFWAAVGLAVIFFSYALVTFVVTALTGGGTSGGGTNVNTSGINVNTSGVNVGR